MIVWSTRPIISIIFIIIFGYKPIKVALSVDRWLSIEFKTWRPLYFRPAQAFMLSFVLLAIISVLSSNLLVLSGNFDQETNTLYCYTEGQFSDWILLWQKVSTISKFLFYFYLINNFI